MSSKLEKKRQERGTAGRLEKIFRNRAPALGIVKYETLRAKTQPFKNKKQKQDEEPQTPFQSKQAACQNTQKRKELTRKEGPYKVARIPWLPFEQLAFDGLPSPRLKPRHRRLDSHTPRHARTALSLARSANSRICAAFSFLLFSRAISSRCHQAHEQKKTNKSATP